MQPEKYFAVYNKEGQRLLRTNNIVKARTFASVRGLQEQSDKGPQLEIAESTRPTSMHPLEPQPSGEKLTENGLRIHKRERKAFENMPLAGDLMSDIISQVKNEKRKDVLIPIKELRMNAEGQIHRLNSRHAYNVEPDAFKQIIKKCGVFPNATRLFSLMAESMVAEVFNHQITRYADDSKFPLGDKIKVGLRELNGKRSIYRFVSPIYASWGADSVLQELQNMIPSQSDARGDFIYNPYSTMVSGSALWHTPKADESICNGDVFKAGIYLKTADKRNSGITARTVAWRIQCSNRQETAMENCGSFYSIHKGDIEKIRQGFQETIIEGREAYASFMTCWNKLSQMNVQKYSLWGKRFDSVEDALEHAVDVGKISLDIANNVLVEHLLSAYKEEEGDDLTALVNAVTRAAHKAPLNTDQQLHLEQTGGRLARELVLLPAIPIQA